jgi:hypothetical protein
MKKRRRDFKRMSSEHNPLTTRDVGIVHRTGSYVCTRNGLLFEGHRCLTAIDAYIPDEEADEEDAHTSVRWVAEMPLSWWKAQCAFRGLKTEGTIIELQDRLRTREEAGALDELKELEEWLMKDIMAGGEMDEPHAEAPGCDCFECRRLRWNEERRKWNEEPEEDIEGSGGVCRISEMDETTSKIPVRRRRGGIICRLPRYRQTRQTRIGNPDKTRLLKDFSGRPR